MTGKRYASKHKELLAANRHLYDWLLEEQEGGCAICGRPPSAKRKLDLDHDHKRMVIRGLLCFRCNRALPSWVTKKWLIAASKYVERTING